MGVLVITLIASLACCLALIAYTDPELLFGLFAACSHLLCFDKVEMALQHLFAEDVGFV